MQSIPLLDRAGRRRSPATTPSFHRGIPPRIRGFRLVLRAAGDDPDGVRLRGLIVVLSRAGSRISEALALSETDLDLSRGAFLVPVVARCDSRARVAEFLRDACASRSPGTCSGRRSRL